MQVKYLYMENNRFSGTVPYMENLLVLNASVNRFSDARFDKVPAMLQLVYLAKNKLAGKMPPLEDWTSSSVNLTLMDLSYNDLFGSLPDAMPPNLAALNISNNAFTGALPSSWSKLKHMADLRLDNNHFTGRLPPAWSEWGNNTGNSLQLSITNSSLHGQVPKQWVEQFCLAIVKGADSRLLVAPTDVSVPNGIGVDSLVGPEVELPAQQASINVTLAGKLYSFDYNNPDSVCGIAHAARNTALLWGLFAALLLAMLGCICLWQRRKPNPEPQGGLLSRWRINTILQHDKLSFGRQVANCVWFLISDVGWTIYDQVTDVITIHQVFSSGQTVYAYILLGILLVPFATMLILVVRVSIVRNQDKVARGTLVSRAAALLTGLLLAPLLFLGLELTMMVHGIGVPLPAWWACLGIDLVTFYRMQSVAEAFLSALPQAIVQSKLYLMGNDPNGVGVYIDTNLFLVSMIGSFFSILKSVGLIAIEVHQYKCSLLAYCLKLVKFETFHSVPWTSV